MSAEDKAIKYLRNAGPPEDEDLRIIDIINKDIEIYQPPQTAIDAVAQYFECQAYWDKDGYRKRLLDLMLLIDPYEESETQIMKSLYDMFFASNFDFTINDEQWVYDDDMKEYKVVMKISYEYITYDCCHSNHHTVSHELILCRDYFLLDQQRKTLSNIIKSRKYNQYL